jgi:site-specific DNA-methyltransferase (adenine-specific)
MKLYNADCLQILPQLIAEGLKVDAVIADPPYGTTACSWDSVIPLPVMWELLERLIKPKGAIVLFGSEPFSSALRMSNIQHYKYDWIWQKSKYGNFISSHYQPIKEHETISIFSDGASSYTKHNGGMIYYPQMWGEATAVNKGQDKDTCLQHQRGRMSEGYRIHSTNTTGQRFPLSILKVPSESKRTHPTQKPVALMEYLIKTYTLEGETVLDFTMGSGSTGVACSNLNRNFIGIELDKTYFDVAYQRIAAAERMNHGEEFFSK